MAYKIALVLRGKIPLFFHAEEMDLMARLSHQLGHIKSESAVSAAKIVVGINY
jgi:hypothetical protein